METSRTIHRTAKVDPLAKALSILRKNLTIGQTVEIKMMITKRGGENAFIDAVKTLINAGWDEYEFTDDYTGIKMIDTSIFETFKK